MIALAQKLRSIRKGARLTPAALRLRWLIAFGEPLNQTTAYGWEQRESAPNPQSLGRFLWICGADDATRLAVYDLLTGYSELPRTEQ